MSGDRELHAEVDALVASHRERIRELQASFSAMSAESAQAGERLAATHAAERSSWEAERKALQEELAMTEMLLGKEKEDRLALEAQLGRASDSAGAAVKADMAKLERELIATSRALDKALKKNAILEEELAEAKLAAAEAAATAAAPGSPSHAESAAPGLPSPDEWAEALKHMALLEETVRAECEERIELKAQIKFLKAQIKQLQR